MALSHLRHQSPGLVEVAHPSEDVECFLEGIGGRGRRCFEGVLEELEGFEAVGVSGEETAENFGDGGR